jgi:hypothetical protein
VTDGRHAVAEETSLELHKAVARRLLAEPELIERARARVEGWLADGAVSGAHAREWQAILSQPIAEVVRAMTRTDEGARALRQASPFAGFLDPRTIWAIRRELSAGRPAR